MYMYLMFPCHSILTRCQFMYSRKGPWTLDAGTNLMRLFMRSQLRMMPTRRKKTQGNWWNWCEGIKFIPIQAILLNYAFIYLSLGKMNNYITFLSIYLRWRVQLLILDLTKRKCNARTRVSFRLMLATEVAWRNQIYTVSLHVIRSKHKSKKKKKRNRDIHQAQYFGTFTNDQKPKCNSQLRLILSIVDMLCGILHNRGLLQDTPGLSGGATSSLIALLNMM